MNLLSKISRRALLLAIFLFSLLNLTHAQEIPNGDGDLLWERPLNGRTVNDAKFHPLNGNIIAAVNHEIWEIDPKDGRTIRVLYAGTSAEEKHHFHSIDLTSDGKLILTDDGDSILVWDYETGFVKQTFHNGETIAWQGLGGIYPDDNKVVFFSYNTEQQIRKLNIYDISTNSIIKSISTYPKSADKVKLSEDGRYLAIGFRYRPQSDMIYTMELWDAETLTKVKDFGSPGDIIEFRDIQISDDNKYVGFLCGGPRSISIYDAFNSKLIKRIENTSAFSFTPNSKIIIYSGTKPEDGQSNIYNLPNMDTVYQYIWARSFFRFNESNEMFTGNKMYSSRWYNVSVNEFNNQDALISVLYSNSKLKITLSNEIIIKNFILTDTLGNIYLDENNLTNDNEIMRTIFLPSAVYILKLKTSTRQEIFKKFVVVE